MDNRRGGFRGNQGPRDRRDSFRGDQDRRGGFRGDQGPREMHNTVCADCGNECQVPFKPSGDRPVYCKECYRKHKKF
ncbi:MAG: CxxC-x17-CxxC domain-containing protein [Candidatus Woesearchaeota archaeon]